MEARPMKTQSFIVGVFDDEETCLTAAEEIHHKGINIYEIFSPFPIHGIDDVLGYKRTRLTIAAFCFGILGLSMAVFHAKLDVWHRLAGERWRQASLPLAQLCAGEL